MDSYNIKLKKGDVEIEVFGPDKEFVSNKFTESILVAFDKSREFKLQDANGKNVQVDEQIIEAVNNESVQAVEDVQQETAAIESNQAVEVAPEQSIAEVSNPAEPVAVVDEQPAVQETAEAIVSSEPIVEAAAASQPAVVETVQESPLNEIVQVVETVQRETAAEVTQNVETVPEQQAVNETSQAPKLGKPALANATQVNEDNLLKVYEFKNGGFKVNRNFDGTAALKQINMTKLVLIASEYVNGIPELSGKALGKHMKAIGTGNLSTNLKGDNGIVKEKGYRLNDAGKKSAIELVKSLSQN